MRKWLCVLLGGILVVFLSCGPSLSITPPFSDPMRVNTVEGEAYPVDRLVGLLHARINELPYLLARYCRTGNVVLERMVRENLSALGLYVKQMGQSIGNSREKEMFAKLLAGSQNLKDLVEKNLKTIEEYRRADRFFQFRAYRLIQWLADRSEELSSKEDSGKTISQNNFATLLEDVRIGLMKAVFLNVVSTNDSENQPRREKSRAMWDTVIQKAEMLREAATSDEEKELAAVLESSSNNVRNLARDLTIRRDELNQAWDQTYSMVESLEALFKPGSPEKAPSSE